MDETEEIIHEKGLESEEVPAQSIQPPPFSEASLPQDLPSPSSLFPFISNAVDDLDDDRHRALCAGYQFPNRSSWPLTGATEILLFQHFINNLSCFVGSICITFARGFPKLTKGTSVRFL